MMKRRALRALALTLSLTMLGASLSGCGSVAAEAAQNKEAEAEESETEAEETGGEEDAEEADTETEAAEETSAEGVIAEEADAEEGSVEEDAEEDEYEYLPRSTPAEQGVDAETILAFVEALEEYNPHSFMIMRNGYVIAEGWWDPYTAEQSTATYSFSKEAVGLAAGFALQEGVFSLDDKIMDYFADKFEEYDYQPSGGIAELTVEDCLTMTFGKSIESDSDFFQEDDWFAAILGDYTEYEPGTTFAYDNRCPFLISALIQDLTGETLFEYLNTRLFEKIGMTSAWWEVADNGYNYGFCGLNLTTEDMCKMMLFIANGGSWDGEQLLDREYIETMTSIHSDGYGEGLEYGYFTWVMSDGILAMGAGGQIGVIFPEYDIIVCTTMGDSSMTNAYFVASSIFGTGTGVYDGAIDEDEDAQAALDEKIASLTLTMSAEGEDTPDEMLEYSGVEYTLSDNEMGLTKVSFDLENQTFCFWIGEDCFEAGYGYEEWVTTDTGFTDQDTFSCLVGTLYGKVGAMGAWTDNTLTMKLSFVESDQTDTVDITFDEYGIVLHYSNVPSMGTFYRSYDFTAYGRPVTE